MTGIIPPYQPLSAGQWVRRAADTPPPDHVCAPPMTTRTYWPPIGPSGVTPPTGGQVEPDRAVQPPVRGQVVTSPDGAAGDLWRCPCGTLWRVGASCEACDSRGRNGAYCPRGGHHPAGYAWRRCSRLRAWWWRHR